MLLVAFTLLFLILSLCLVFVSLISMCLGVFLLEFVLYGTLCLFINVSTILNDNFIGEYFYFQASIML